MYFFEKKFSRAEDCAEDCVESEVTSNPCRFNFSIQSVTDCHDLTSLCFKALF